MAHTMMSCQRITVGLDLGDRYSQFCLVDQSGTVVEEGRLRTTPDALQRYFTGRPPMRIVIEVGTHSPPRFEEGARRTSPSLANANVQGRSDRTVNPTTNPSRNIEREA